MVACGARSRGMRCARPTACSADGEEQGKGQRGVRTATEYSSGARVRRIQQGTWLHPGKATDLV